VEPFHIGLDTARVEQKHCHHAAVGSEHDRCHATHGLFFTHLCEVLHVGGLDVHDVEALVVGAQVPQVHPQIVRADEGLLFQRETCQQLLIGAWLQRSVGIQGSAKVSKHCRGLRPSWVHAGHDLNLWHAPRTWSEFMLMELMWYVCADAKVRWHRAFQNTSVTDTYRCEDNMLCQQQCSAAQRTQ
jgi:hypothetical protein